MMEREIRTPCQKLLFCKLVFTNDRKLVLELKNGKRVEQLPIDVFLNEINNFAQECAPKLHIVVE